VATVISRWSGQHTMPHMIQIKAVARLPPTRWQMPFNPRRAFIIEVAGAATVILSVALVACVLFSIR
jgi:hypothetical protein